MSPFPSEFSDEEALVGYDSWLRTTRGDWRQRLDAYDSTADAAVKARTSLIYWAAVEALSFVAQELQPPDIATTIDVAREVAFSISSMGLSPADVRHAVGLAADRDACAERAEGDDPGGRWRKGVGRLGHDCYNLGAPSDFTSDQIREETVDALMTRFVEALVARPSGRDVVWLLDYLDATYETGGMP